MSKLDEYYTLPTYTAKYLCPERICDNIQYQLKLLGVHLSDESYACIWDDVDRRNRRLDLVPMTESEKYADRRRLSEKNAVQ
jgi:hypothetical protein